MINEEYFCFNRTILMPQADGKTKAVTIRSGIRPSHVSRWYMDEEGMLNLVTHDITDGYKTIMDTSGKKPIPKQIKTQANVVIVIDEPEHIQAWFERFDPGYIKEYEALKFKTDQLQPPSSEPENYTPARSFPG